MNITKTQLFKRQTVIQEFGELGQQKLQDAEILIIGCGGLGSVAAVYLAASGIGNIHLIDFDVVKVSNLPHQVFYKTKDIGKGKASVLANHIQSISPFVNVTYSEEKINKANAINIIDEFEIVLDCTNNLSTKYLINDVCVITDTILIYGSIHKFEGYIATFNMTKGSKRTSNLRDAFPEMSSHKNPDSSEVGILNPMVGIIGAMQANEVIKIITRISKPLFNQILIYNSLNNSQIKIKLSSKPCYKKADRGCILKSFKHESYEEPIAVDKTDPVLIDHHKFFELQATAEIISVIEEENYDLPLENSIKIPYYDFNTDVIKWQKDKKYIVICKKGVLSYSSAKMVKSKYQDIEIYSLKNGVEFLKSIQVKY